ncbi:hypothetical protein G7046_g265 [Stylonectria norvegica]|nr:hypothetical protein G7046_g265 [Stylonectria norvegica]
MSAQQETTIVPATDSIIPVAVAPEPAAQGIATQEPVVEAPVVTEPAAAVAEAPQTPLSKLNARLPEILTKAAHSEMWGVELSNVDHVPTQVVLTKFLRANTNDAAAAEKQLISALEWRKKMQPDALVKQTFDKKKFDDLGFVTTHLGEDGKETIITWNIYGAVKDNKATFGNVDEFIKWRAAVMELSVKKLNLSAVTVPIADGGEDPYQMIQVHDYQSVSFFRVDPAVKAASKETIAVFSMAYPELLSHKYFVNVPAIMGWMFGAMKLFLAPATLKKFHPMTSGTTLATELKNISSTLPKEYGGQGPSVKEGVSVKLDVVDETPTETPVAAVAESKPTESTPAVSTEKAAEDTTPAAVTLPIRENKPAEEAKAGEEVKPVESLAPVTEDAKAETTAPEETKLATGTEGAEADKKATV